jgi:hypothetical protein
MGESNGLPPTWHSQKAQASRCFYCGVVGQAWFQCECESTKLIREGKRSKPRVVVKDGRTLVIHDVELYELACANSGLPRYRRPGEC